MGVLPLYNMASALAATVLLALLLLQCEPKQQTPLLLPALLLQLQPCCSGLSEMLALPLALLLLGAACCIGLLPLLLPRAAATISLRTSRITASTA
jgi:hypothetical protein